MTKAEDIEEFQRLRRRFGDWVYCSCGERVNLQLWKEDYRKFKLEKIKNRIS